MFGIDFVRLFGVSIPRVLSTRPFWAVPLHVPLHSHAHASRHSRLHSACTPLLLWYTSAARDTVSRCTRNTDGRAPVQVSSAHESCLMRSDPPSHFETPERISRRIPHLETSPASLKTGSGL
eukprot:6704091-Prymnesium_polylepis.2